MKKLAILPILAAVLLLSCETVPPLPTPSGKPEAVFAPGVSKKRIVDTLANEMLTKGYKIGEFNEYTARFVKHWSTSTYVNGQWVETPGEWRVIFNLVDTPSGVRCVCTVEHVQWPGSHREKVDDYSQYGSTSHEYHDMLARLAANLAPVK